jgi:hypothetical protein
MAFSFSCAATALPPLRPRAPLRNFPCVYRQRPRVAELNSGDAHPAPVLFLPHLRREAWGIPADERDGEVQTLRGTGNLGRNREQGTRVRYYRTVFSHLAVAEICNLTEKYGQKQTDEQEALFSLLLGID